MQAQHGAGAARFEGGPSRPNIEPQWHRQATEPRPPPPTGDEPRQKGGKTSKLQIPRSRPSQSRARHRARASRVTRICRPGPRDPLARRELPPRAWQKPDGDMMTAPCGRHQRAFRAELRSFVLAQYHRGQMTVPRLLAQLRAFGIVISNGSSCVC